jgi:hypothetical protein
MIKTARAMREYAVTNFFVKVPSICVKKMSMRPQMAIHHTITNVDISRILFI